MEAILFVILQIFFTTHAVLEMGNVTLILPSFSWGIFSRVMHLNQSHASGNSY